MQQIQVRISKIVEETPDARSFYLEQVDGTPIPYIAGQFLTFLFLVNGKEIRRSFSIGSTPDYEEDVFITVKRKENGEVSRKLLDKYHVGDVLTCLMPSGKFIKESDWEKNIYYFFFAAGSGIVPIFSVIKSILHQYPTARIFLHYQSASESKTIYKKQLEDLAGKYDHFEYQLFLSRPENPLVPVRRLNNMLVEKMVRDRLQTDTMRTDARFYICGPIPYMRMVRFTLKLDGFADTQIKQEQFVIQEHKYAPPLLNDESPKLVKVISDEGNFDFEVQYPESILLAARKHKIPLPYSCGAGQCSTCAVVCSEGEVLMSSNDILTQKDLDNRLVLTCTGHPVTDIVLDYTIKK